MKEFTADKFFDVFFWAKDILDYEKSTPVGKWFLQSMTILLYLNCRVIKFTYDIRHLREPCPACEIVR
jgi:hypothetical protein